MKVVWSSRAVPDLRAITDYIQLDSPQAAARVAARLFAEVEQLAALPQRGRIGTVPGTRELIVVPWPYIAVYRVIADEVRIVRIRHAAQQWPPFSAIS